MTINGIRSFCLYHILKPLGAVYGRPTANFPTAIFYPFSIEVAVGFLMKLAKAKLMHLQERD